MLPLTLPVACQHVYCYPVSYPFYSHWSEYWISGVATHFLAYSLPTPLLVSTRLITRPVLIKRWIEAVIVIDWK